MDGMENRFFLTQERTSPIRKVRDQDLLYFLFTWLIASAKNCRSSAGDNGNTRLLIVIGIARDEETDKVVSVHGMRAEKASKKGFDDGVQFENVDRGRWNKLHSKHED